MKDRDSFPFSHLLLVLPSADEPDLLESLAQVSSSFRSRIYWAVDDSLAEGKISGAVTPWAALESGNHSYVLYISSDNPQSADLVKKIQELAGRVVIHPSLSRIWGDAADLCCLLPELEEKVDDLLRHSISARTREQIAEHLPEICDLLAKQTGLDFQRYSQAFVCRRVERRMVATRKFTVSDYLTFLRAQPLESQSLFSELSVGLTEFFGEPECIELLRQHLLKRLDKTPRLKVWCIGCSSGEEAYTVAITALRVFQELGHSPDLKVMATDINDEALEVARAARYSRLELEGKLEPDLLEQYFVADGEGFRVSREVRQVCQFFKHDLTTDAPLPEVDLIVCRSVLIYLSAALLDKLPPIFHYSLAPGGVLLIGGAETLGEASVLFKAVEPGASLYSKIEDKSKLLPPGPTGTSANKPGQLDLTAIVGRIIAEEFTPRSVVVNQQGAIVWSSGRLESLFLMGRGDFRNHVLAMARPGLKNPLRSALMEATREQRTTVIQGVRIEASSEGPALFVDITVQPMPNIGSELGLYLVVVQERPMQPWETTESPEAAKIVALERELSRVNGELSQAVSELESVNMELKCSNEELLSMNEELRVANEKLETARNESEGKHRLLTQTSLDLNHLLSATNIPTIFLDVHNCLQRFTPSSARIYPFQPSDIGRPISEIRDHAVEMPPLPATSEAASDSEIELRDGSWWVRRISPYVGSEGVVVGMVVTFSEVTELRASKTQLNDSLQQLENVYNQAPVGLAVLDENLDTIRQNRLFGLLERTIPTRVQEAAQEALATQQRIEGIEFQVAGPAGVRDLSVSLFPMLLSGVKALNLIVQDVTRLKQYESQAYTQERALDAINELVVLADTQGVIQYVNVECQRTLGIELARRILLTDLLVSEEISGFSEALPQRLLEPTGWTGTMLLRNQKTGLAVTAFCRLIRVPASPKSDHYYIGLICREISGELAALERIEQLERAQWELLDRAPIGVALVDANHEFLYLNDAASKLVSEDPRVQRYRERLEVFRVPLPPSEVYLSYPELEESSFRVAHQKALRGEEQVVSGFFGPNDRFYTAYYFPHMLGVLAYFTDDTEVHLAREQAREMVQAVSGSSDLIATFDLDLQVKFINRAGLTMLAEDAPSDLNLRDFYLSQDVGRILDGIKSLSSGEHCSVEAVLLGRDQRLTPVSQHFQVVKGENGSIHGYTTIARDISEIHDREASLKESESRFRRAILEAPIPVLIVAAGGELLAVSEMLLSATGYRFEEISLLRHWLLIAHRTEADRAGAVLESWFDSESPREDFESVVFTRSGEPRYWRFTSSLPGLMEDGRSYIVVMALDLTDRLEKEQVLQAGSEFLRRTLDSLFVFAAVITPEGVVVEINQAALGTANLDPSDVLGKRLEDTFWWNYDSAVQAQLREAIAQASRGNASRYDVEIRTSLERTITLDFQLMPMRDQEGRITHLVPSGLDVSERRRLEKEHQTDKRRFRTLLDSTAEAIFGIDLFGQCIFANPACLRLLGFDSDDEILARNTHHLFHHLKPDGTHHDEHDCPIFQALKSGTAAYVPVDHFIRKDGSFFPVELWAHPKFDQGKLTGCVVTFFDITEKLKLAEDLSAAKASAESANQAKSDFLANMSHEIRTPMAAILGYVDILLRQVRNPDDIDCLKIIQRNGLHLLEIINDILDLSKIEAGRLQLEVINLSISAVILEVCTLMEVRAREKGLELNVSYHGLIPETISSDPTRIRQILVNLIGNAIKFSENGRIDISVANGLEGELCISVADCGIGISQEHISLLFQPFSQADTSVTRRFGGTGLGLAISRKLVEMLGGCLSVESEVGVGSNFCFTLKTGDISGVARVELKSGQVRAPQPMSASYRIELSGIRALVVDDRRDIRYLVQSYLEEAGATVDVCDDGRAALEKVSAKAPDILLLDMQMPILDGYSTAKLIREKGMRFPILALTASAMKYDRGLCLEAGCDGYLTKPVDRLALLHHVESLVRGRKSLQVLVVEDNPMAGLALRAMLTSLGCQAEVAGNGELALEMAEKSPPDFAFIDLGLPTMSGWELLKRLKAKGYDCRYVAHSGLQVSEVTSQSQSEMFDFVVQKPVTRDQIQEVLFGISAV